MSSEVLKVVKLSENATIPSRMSAKAAGLDITSAYDYLVPAKGKMLCKTDLSIGIPEGYYGRLAPRSGLAAKHSIQIGAGVVDSDYTGNVSVLLFNFGDDDFVVNHGDRICQLICERICTPEVKVVNSLDVTERASGSFGSTGR